MSSVNNIMTAQEAFSRAEELFLALKDAGIFVRYFSSPRIDNYLRITVGTDAQMEALYRFLERYLNRGKSV